MLFLNGTDGVHNKPIPFNEHLMKVNEFYGAFGYIINSRFYNEALKWLYAEQKPVDSIYSMFIQFYKVYRTKKPLIFHRSGISDIQGVIPKNYKHLEKSKHSNQYNSQK